MEVQSLFDAIAVQTVTLLAMHVCWGYFCQMLCYGQCYGGDSNSGNFCFSKGLNKAGHFLSKIASRFGDIAQNLNSSHN